MHFTMDISKSPLAVNLWTHRVYHWLIFYLFLAARSRPTTKRVGRRRGMYSLIFHWNTKFIPTTVDFTPIIFSLQPPGLNLNMESLNIPGAPGAGPAEQCSIMWSHKALSGVCNTVSQKLLQEDLICSVMDTFKRELCVYKCTLWMQARHQCSDYPWQKSFFLTDWSFTREELLLESIT